MNRHWHGAIEGSAVEVCAHLNVAHTEASRVAEIIGEDIAPLVDAYGVNMMGLEAELKTILKRIADYDTSDIDRPCDDTEDVVLERAKYAIWEMMTDARGALLLLEEAKEAKDEPE